MGKLVFLIALGGVGVLLSGVCELVYLGSADTGNMEQLMTGLNYSQASGITGILTVTLDFTIAFIGTIVEMAFFNYAFFENEYSIFRFIFLFPLAAGIFYMIAINIRGTNTS